jgi:hypothetical protein
MDPEELVMLPEDIVKFPADKEPEVEQFSLPNEMAPEVSVIEAAARVKVPTVHETAFSFPEEGLAVKEVFPRRLTVASGKVDITNVRGRSFVSDVSSPTSICVAEVALPNKPASARIVPVDQKLTAVGY